MFVYEFLAKLVIQEVWTPKSEILRTNDTCAKRFQLSFRVFCLAKQPRNSTLKLRFLLHDRRALTLMLEGNTKLGWLGPVANFEPISNFWGRKSIFRENPKFVCNSESLRLQIIWWRIDWLKQNVRLCVSRKVSPPQSSDPEVWNFENKWYVRKEVSPEFCSHFLAKQSRNRPLKLRF